MNGPLVFIGLIALFISHLQLSTADCNYANAKGNSGEAACRKDEAPKLVERKPHSGESGEVSRASPGSPATASSPASPSGPSGTPPASSSEELFDCELTEAMRNLSVLLTVDQQIVWSELIYEIEVEIMEDVTLTDIEKVVKASYKIKHFLSVNLDISVTISFLQIGGWGSFFDFGYVSIDLQADFSEQVVTLDQNDDCDLFDSLRNATKGDSVKYAATLTLIEDLKFILIDVSFTHGQKMGLIHKILEEFFNDHPDWEDFYKNITIPGFGSLESFDDVCHGYNRALTISAVLVGSSDSDCPVLKSLSDAVANTTLTISVRSQIKQFHDKLAVYFASVTDVDKRMAYVTAQYWQMIIMEPFIVQYMSVISINDMSGNKWGLFYDLIWVSQFCNNTGSCGCMSCGLGMPDCPSRPNLIVISAQNTTILTDVLTVNYNSWNSSTRLGFNTCFNQVRGAIWNKTATVAQKINAIVGYFKAYNANNVYKQQVLFNCTIDVWDGEIQDFVNCGNM